MQSRATNRRAFVKSEHFALRKWYLDGTSRDGRSLIGYWSSLSWRSLSVVWQSVSSYAPDTPPARRWSVRGSSPPARSGSTLVWESVPLRASLEIESPLPPITQRLWADDARSTSVVWQCESPVGLVRATVDGSPFDGVGYAECLSMNVTPWRLPIRELWWGRWCDDAATRSVVWIEWRGPEPRRWVFLDGVGVEAAVGSGAIAGARFTLTLTESVTLEDRSIAEALDGIPQVVKVVPRPVREMRERKWRSRGSLVCGGQVPVAGHAIHEVVVFP